MTTLGDSFHQHTTGNFTALDLDFSQQAISVAEIKQALLQGLKEEGVISTPEAVARERDAREASEKEYNRRLEQRTQEFIRLQTEHFLCQDEVRKLKEKVELLTSLLAKATDESEDTVKGVLEGLAKQVRIDRKNADHAAELSNNDRMTFKEYAEMTEKYTSTPYYPLHSAAFDVQGLIKVTGV